MNFGDFIDIKLKKTSIIYLILKKYIKYVVIIFY